MCIQPAFCVYVDMRIPQIWELVTVFGVTIAGSIMLFLYIFVNPFAKVARSAWVHGRAHVQCTCACERVHACACVRQGGVVPTKVEMLDGEPESHSKIDSQMKLRGKHAMLDGEPESSAKDKETVVDGELDSVSMAGSGSPIEA